MSNNSSIIPHLSKSLILPQPLPPYKPINHDFHSYTRISLLFHVTATDPNVSNASSRQSSQYTPVMMIVDDNLISTSIKPNDLRQWVHSVMRFSLHNEPYNPAQQNNKPCNPYCNSGRIARVQPYHHSLPLFLGYL